MHKYQFLFFDIDDTLLSFYESMKYALKKCFDDFGLEMKDEIYETYWKINESKWKKLELGEITKREVEIGRFVDLFQVLKITDIDIEAFQNEYQGLLGDVYFYLDDSLKVLTELSQDYHIYYVTNGTASIQRKKLRLSGLDQVCDGIFISEELGEVKPQKAFFDKAFAQIPLFDPAKAVLIGDSLSSDMTGGRNAGIDTIWYRPKGEEDSRGLSDYIITNLSEIKKILE